MSGTTKAERKGMRTRRRGAKASSLALEFRGGAEWLTLARPRRLNAIDLKMAEELGAYFDGLRDRPEVRVVVLRGAGEHFCAGFDLDGVPQISESVVEATRLQRAMSDIVPRMRRCPQPIVAAIQGAACGAGFALALASDVRYAAEGARMNVAMARIGLTGCDMGISYFLPRAVGASNAAELMMGGRFIDAERARDIGLVSDVTPPAGLEARADKMAREMLAMSPEGLRLTKEGLSFAQDAPNLDAVIAMEDRGQILCIGRYMSEGVAAFRAGRAPRYRS